jgi:DNA polymerase III gamma/tau subunit
MLRAAAGAGQAAADDPRLARQAAAFGLSRLVRGLEQLAQVEKDARWSDQSRLALEVALVRLMRLEGDPSPGAVDPSPYPLPEAERGKATDVSPLSASGVAKPRPERFGGGRFPAESSGPTGAGGEGSTPTQDDPFTAEEAREPDAAEPEAPPVPPPSRPVPPLPSQPSPGLAAIQGRWSVVTEELKRRKAVNTNALLADARPVRLEGETLVVGFRYSPLLERFQQKKENQQHLEAALHAVFGARYEVRAEVLPEGSEGAPSRDVTAERFTPSTREPIGAATGESDPAGEMLPRAATARPPARDAPTPAVEGEAPAGDRLIHEVIAIFNGKIVEE